VLATWTSALLIVGNVGVGRAASNARVLQLYQPTAAEPPVKCWIPI